MDILQINNNTSQVFVFVIVEMSSGFIKQVNSGAFMNSQAKEFP